MFITLRLQLDTSAGAEHPLGGYCVEARADDTGTTVISHGHLSAKRVMRMLEDEDTAGVREAAADELLSGRDRARSRVEALEAQGQEARTLATVLTDDVEVDKIVAGEATPGNGAPTP